MLKLVKLTYEYKEQLTNMLEEWLTYNNTHPVTNHSPWMIFRNDYHDFDYYIKNLELKEPMDGRVPDSTFYLLDTERNIFLGAVNIRHYLNDGLLLDGGHIGDGIRPSERQKGYATKMIALALEECKKLGLKRVLICCDKDNIGSAKQIKNNGGVLESELIEPETNNIEQRYWIELDNNYIEGKNVVLRKAKVSDLQSLLDNFWNDPNVYNTMWFKPIDNIEEAKKRLLEITNLQVQKYCYTIALKSTDEAIGLCGIEEIEDGIYDECGIGISSKYQGKGYGKEALSLLLDLVFNKLNANEFQYSLIKGNNKSEGLKNAFNFKYFKTEVEVRPWDNKSFELEYYKLNKEDYK